MPTQSWLALITWELISQRTLKNIANCENTLIVSGPLPLPARDILCDGAPERIQVMPDLRIEVGEKYRKTF